MTVIPVPCSKPEYACLDEFIIVLVTKRIIFQKKRFHNGTEGIFYKPIIYTLTTSRKSLPETGMHRMKIGEGST
ncbi:MAG: hypothetical protein BGO78_16615 [Chloroflexi bacterium 44-23]|nr:MAG: hypothetical protein BGO78_16615 [Chloroflexi bacterium 44-23]